MKRDAVIKLRDLLADVDSEVKYLNEVLRKEDIFVAKSELKKIQKKCRTAFDYAVKLEYQK